MASCLSELRVCIPTAAMMFCLCTTIAPAVSNGDERVNRLQPTDAHNYCSLIAAPTDTLADSGAYTHSIMCTNATGQIDERKVNICF